MRHPLVATAGAVTVAIAAVAGSLMLSAPAGDRRAGPLGAALVLAAVAATVLAILRPLTGVSACAVALGAYLGRHYPYGPILAVGLVAVFVVGLRGDRARAAAAVAIIEAGVIVGQSISDRHDVLVLLYPGWSLAAALLGDAVRSRRHYLAERAVSIERSRKAEAARELAEQRLQIARDLHDGVAHALAIINVQSAAAARVLETRPQAAKDALEAITGASRGVLDELNAMVRVLRDRDRRADRHPTPGLADIADLVDATRETGIACDLEFAADGGGVGTSVGTAAYRIVQESLTNVLRHSGARRATVSVIAPADGGLVVQVRDDGSGTSGPSDGIGAGIVGMRERATATGGTLTAGRGATGYVVRAEWVGRP